MYSSLYRRLFGYYRGNIQQKEPRSTRCSVDRMVTVWRESKFVILGQVLREWMHFLENAESSDAGVVASINTTELVTVPNWPRQA